MFRPEPLDIVLIIFVALLLFGANRLPETARAIGQSMREFRRALAGKDDIAPVQSESTRPAKIEPMPSAAPAPAQSEPTRLAKIEPMPSAAPAPAETISAPSEGNPTDTLSKS